MSTDNFEIYGIIELFGHSIIAGKITEQTIAGGGFIRVDVPDTKLQKGFTKWYGASAIYAMTPCDEESMIAAVEGLRSKPIENWSLNLPNRIEAPEESEYDDPDPFLDQDRRS